VPRSPLKKNRPTGSEPVDDYFDEDWRNFVACVRYLPALAKKRGVAFAVAWHQTQVRALVDLMAVGMPETRENAVARSQVASFFRAGSARLLAADTVAGFNFATDFITVVEHEIYAQGVRAIFDKSPPRSEGEYVPNIPAPS